MTQPTNWGGIGVILCLVAVAGIAIATKPDRASFADELQAAIDEAVTMNSPSGSMAKGLRQVPCSGGASSCRLMLESRLDTSFDDWVVLRHASMRAGHIEVQSCFGMFNGWYCFH